MIDVSSAQESTTTTEVEATTTTEVETTTTTEAETTTTTVEELPGQLPLFEAPVEVTQGDAEVVALFAGLTAGALAGRAWFRD